MLMTKRCELTAISEKDYESIWRLYVDEDVRKYLDGIVDEISFSIRFQMMLESNYYWTVRLKDTKEFIGLVCLDIGHDMINTEIGYQFLPAYWGKGYAKEVVERVIEYGFHSLKLTTIVAETPTVNERACRLLRRVGMKFEKTLKRFGSEQCMFSIQKGTWRRWNLV
jgi:[ribosomal protein S5]-alanine N-acetyltransferase